MAKPKLTKEAIKYIASLYDSETENHTFLEIKEKIQVKFGIVVSLQAVQQNYHKYTEEISKEEKASNLETIQNKDIETDKKADDIRPVPKSSPSSIFGAFGVKKQTGSAISKQYQDVDDLGVTSNEIKDLLKVDK